MTDNNYPQQGQQVVYVQQPKKKKTWLWILLAIFAVIIIGMVGCTALVGKGVSDAVDQVEKDSNTEVAVTYRVSGASQDATLTYQDSDNNMGQDTNVALPWEKEVITTGSWRYVSVTATNGMYDEGEITCEILANGEVITTQTSSGAGASASCNTSDIPVPSE